MNITNNQNPSRRKLLSYLVAVGFLVALIAITWTLSSTLSPNAKAKANVRSFQINEVPIGTLKITPEGDYALIVARRSEFEFAIFETSLLRRTVGQIYFIFPGHFECKDISMEEYKIVCSGLHTPSLKWNLDGTPYEDSRLWVSELPLLPYAIKGGAVRYGKGA